MSNFLHIFILLSASEHSENNMLVLSLNMWEFLIAVAG